MLVKLDDDLMAKYDQFAQESRQPLATIVERQLARFSSYPPSARMVVLSRETLQEVETRLGGGQIQTPSALLDRIRQFAQLKFGSIEIPLTPAQKDEVLARAAKQGKSPEAILRDLVDQITEQLFYGPVPTR